MKKKNRKGIAITGWSMTLIGTFIILAWLIIEAAQTITTTPVQTVIGVVVVLALLILLVPAPLLIATRRAAEQRARNQVLKQQ